MTKVPVWFVAGVLLASSAMAQTAREAELQARVDRLEQRLSDVEGKSDENWLNERRAEEIKGLVREVINDADTRASLLADGATAGHDGKALFIGSAGGEFLLKVGGQIQFRYLFNGHNGNAGDREDEGFQMRRAKLAFSGHVTAGPKWSYDVVLAVNRTNGALDAEDVIVGTALAEGVEIQFGKFKIPFLREELNSSKRLLAVERGQATEFFTLDRAEQIQISYEGDMFRAWASINDGADSEFTTIGSDNVELAVAARIEVKIMGNWKQIDDIGLAWMGEETGLIVGGAVTFQLGDGPNAGAAAGLGGGGGQGAAYSNSDYFGWTVDANFETNNIGLFAALMGGHINADGTGGTRNMYGVMAQASYNINDQFNPFLRFEWVDGGGATKDLYAITFGMNYFFKKHNAKLTVDVKWELSGATFAGNTFGNATVSDGFGQSLGDTHGKDSFVIRIQFQLLF
ncbi:MAG: porin [Phycisphaeraceae bacterium]